MKERKDTEERIKKGKAKVEGLDRQVDALTNSLKEKDAKLDTSKEALKVEKKEKDAL